jgi:hypothetical protein
MESLSIYGRAHNVTSEIEIFNDSEFGMDVVICRYDDGIEVRRNCTEFHHLFDTKEEILFSHCASAFESDIHTTGGTISYDKIKWIIVEHATKLHDSHR